VPASLGDDGVADLRAARVGVVPADPVPDVVTPWLEVVEESDPVAVAVVYSE